MLNPGESDWIALNTFRVLAPNPGIFTGPGTNSYVIHGQGSSIVIDPGPEDDDHYEALQDACAGPISHVLLTHTHPDHAPLARRIKAECGAVIVGLPAPEHRPQYRDAPPDVIPEDGVALQPADVDIKPVHTPGHASNHVCFYMPSTGLLFTGDHINQGATVVINPPDGNMADYFASLRKCGQLNPDAIAPGHGELIDNPVSEIERLIAHREKREEKVYGHLTDKPQSLDVLVKGVYDEVDVRLHPIAERSLLAHLEHLALHKRAQESENGWTKA